MIRAETGARRRIGLRSYLFLYILFAGIVFTVHLWMVRLPYFWDEAGQFVPAALDILRDGSLIPHSTLPNIHPPGIPALLAGVWRVAGFSPVASRLAMLSLAAFGAMAAFLLAIELSRDAKGAPALVAAAALVCSPLFFAQSVLVQLDMPAMLFTTLALLLFLQDHPRASAAACLALVLVKETGLVTPLTLGAWLAWERRWRDAGWFLLPVAALAGWIAFLARHTGNWAGNPDFVSYNVRMPLHPLRIMATFARRVYFLLIANFHWVGSAAIIYGWRRRDLFRSRPWRIAALLLAAHVALFTLLGGAILNRYLLPVMPVLFAAMAVAIFSLPRRAKIGATCLLLAGLSGCNFLNPPYPFPYEENLAFVDFVKLHAEAADYIAHWHSDPIVHTAWPMSAELSRPDLGYVPRPIRVVNLPDLTSRTLEGLDWSKVDVVVAFSRDQHGGPAWRSLASLLKLWEGFYGFVPDATLDEWRARTPFPAEASFSRGGQWVEIYVNPASGAGRN